MKLTKEQEEFIKKGLRLLNKNRGTKPVHKLHEINDSKLSEVK